MRSLSQKSPNLATALMPLIAQNFRLSNAVMLEDTAKGLEPQTRKLFEVCRMRSPTADQD